VVRLAPHYQIVLTREGVLDAMTVEVEIAPGVPSDEDSLAGKGKEVQWSIKSLIGVTCDVDMKRPGEIPRSQGKAVRVRDLRK